MRILASFKSCRPLDLLRVVGRSEPVRVFELLGEPGDDLGALGNALPPYEAGAAAYRARNFAAAVQHFYRALAACPDQPVAITSSGLPVTVPVRRDEWFSAVAPQSQACET